jgi:hypothetical protein
VVDPGCDPGIRPALLVAGEDRHNDRADEAVLQPAPPEGADEAIDDGHWQPNQVGKIARILDVPEEELVSMNRRLAEPDRSLNVLVSRDSRDSSDEGQDWLVDETEGHEATIAERKELRFAGFS